MRLTELACMLRPCENESICSFGLIENSLFGWKVICKICIVTSDWQLKVAVL